MPGARQLSTRSPQIQKNRSPRARRRDLEEFRCRPRTSSRVWQKAKITCNALDYTYVELHKQRLGNLSDS
ncbi:hypothetical protein AOLI_G00190290 [Acnodon oligacanthus]